MPRPAPKHPFRAHETDMLRHLNANNGNLVFVTGQHATVAASDTKVTGLATVSACGGVLDSDPVAGAQFVTISLGDQAGTPAAGSMLIKTWKATAAGDTALIPATTFAKKVNWWAIGTVAAEIDDAV